MFVCTASHVHCGHRVVQQASEASAPATWPRSPCAPLSSDPEATILVAPWEQERPGEKAVSACQGDSPYKPLSFRLPGPQVCAILISSN